MIGGGKKPRSARFILYLDSGSACRSSPAAMDYQKIIPNAKGQSAFFSKHNETWRFGEGAGSYVILNARLVDV
jgi:hypothetical protein